MEYKLRLNNSLLGWMLVPCAEGYEPLLNELYADNWAKMKPSARAFCKGEPIDKVLDHLNTVFKDMGIKASYCGRWDRPTVRLWWNPKVLVTPISISVDLKWSCWSVAREYWDEYAPNVWDQMEKAFRGEATPVTINTGPRKEIRYGSVTISKGEASGYFCTEWDDPESLADTLGTVCDEGFREMIPYSVHNMEPGMDWEFGVKARSFAKLMERIDAEENNLLETDAREWGYIKDCFKPEA